MSHTVISHTTWCTTEYVERITVTHKHNHNVIDRHEDAIILISNISSMEYLLAYILKLMLFGLLQFVSSSMMTQYVHCDKNRGVPRAWILNGLRFNDIKVKDDIYRNPTAYSILIIYSRIIHYDTFNLGSYHFCSPLYICVWGRESPPNDHDPCAESLRIIITVWHIYQYMRDTYVLLYLYVWHSQ